MVFLCGFLTLLTLPSKATMQMEQVENALSAEEKKANKLETMIFIYFKLQT